MTIRKRVEWTARLILVCVAVVSLTLIATTALAQSGAPPAVTIPGGAVVLGVLQWLAGFAWKKWSGGVNQAIGWLTYVLGLFGFAVIPGEANAAGFFSMSLGPLKALAWPVAAALQTWVVTGIHEWVRGSIIEPLNGKMNKATAYLSK